MRPQFGTRDEVETFLVPHWPLPVTCIFDRVGRQWWLPLLAILLEIGQRVFVGRIRREAEFQRDLVVLVVRIFAPAAIFRRRSLEIGRHAEAIRLTVSRTGLQIPHALIGADIDVGAARIFLTEPDADITFKCPGRFARNQVDRATQRIRPVGHRTEALGHLHRSQIAGAETAKVNIAVIGNIDRDAVDEEGRLAGIVTAQINGLLIA